MHAFNCDYLQRVAPMRVFEMQELYFLIEEIFEHTPRKYISSRSTYQINNVIDVMYVGSVYFRNYCVTP